MAGEFTKSTNIRPAIAGTIANPDEYNQNIAGQSKDSILGIDLDGNFVDFDIGDGSKGANGSLVTDILARDTASLEIYNSSGVLQQSTLLTALSSPTGVVSAFAMSSAPSGWLECDGSAISRTTYSILFGIIGATWGSGDGSTTFNIPDLRGEFIRGWDNGRGIDSGRSFASYQADDLKLHGHAFRKNTQTGAGSDTTGGIMLNNNSTTDIAASTASPNNSFPIGGAGGSETRPRNYSLMYCIKY